MKKIIYIFLCLIIVSCGKDDDTAEVELTDPLIGVWLSEGTVEEDGGVFSYNFTLTVNSDYTGTESAIFSIDGESDTEKYSFTWENKGLDFKATSQTYNFKYSGEESGEDEVATFSNDFKTLNLGGDNDGLNPFKKQ